MWEWANRRVENAAASRLLLSLLRPSEGPLGTLPGPLGCLLLLGKGSYQGPLLPASANSPSVSYSPSRGALSFCLQPIRECHTPLPLVPGRGLYITARLRPQLPAAKRCCSRELETLQRAVSVVSCGDTPQGTASSTDFYNYSQQSRHLDSARAVEGEGSAPALGLRGYLVPLAEAGAKGNSVLVCAG